MGKENKTFDVLTLPLEGRHLIEASAGTGKTFTITRLFLRLIIEGRHISQIVVVSFTNAAVSELRERIRKTLTNTLAYLRNQEENIEADISKILEYYPKKNNTLAKLEIALKQFDSIHVYTIHAFCKHLLEEQPFTSGVLAIKETSPNDYHIARETILDYWRKYIQNSPKEFLEYLIQIDFTAEDWVSFFTASSHYSDWNLSLKKKKQQNGKAHTIINHAVIQQEEKVLKEQIKRCQKAFSDLQKKWSQEKNTITSHFTEHKKVNRLQKGTLASLLASLEKYFQKEAFSLFDKEFRDLITRFYKKETSVALSDGSSSYLWEDYRKSYNKLLILLREHLLFLFFGLKKEYKESIYKKKGKLGLLSYNDLIYKVHQNICSLSTENAMLERIRKKYRIAMIDEFQDTDTLQIEIFDKIFDKAGWGLFAIGDPKQSIYSFRGGDIGNYQKWKMKTNSLFSLSKNYRSTPRLMEGIQAIYTNHTSSPFHDLNLEYFPVKAAIKQEENHLKWKWEAQKKIAKKTEEIPLQFILSDASSDKASGDNINDEKRKYVAERITEEISHLMELAKKNELCHKNQPLCVSDICVLVAKNKQGLLIQEALQKKNIPSTLSMEESVFFSKEALDLLTIFQVILNERRAFGIKMAISTELWGYTVQDIQDLFLSESEKNNVFKRLHNYKKNWEKKGFMSMFRDWFYGEGLYSDLLRRKSGERSLTNILHIAELIHINDERQPQKNIEFLQNEIHKAQLNPRGDEITRLRTESNRDAVQILTIHASKGLEFPIVFCPYLWDFKAKTKPKETFHYYDKEKGQHILTPHFLQKVLEYPLLLSKEIVQSKFVFQKKEITSLSDLKEVHKIKVFCEQLRLIYVGITRASERLYIYWEKNKEKSPASYLFSGGKEDKKTLEEQIQDIATICPEGIFVRPEKGRDTKKEITHKAEGLSNYPNRSQEQPSSLEVNTYQAQPPSLKRKLYSFTSLTRFQREWELSNTYNKYNQMPSYSLDTRQKEQDQVKIKNTSKNIFTFPKGSQAGLFFHEFLEKMNFKKNHSENTRDQNFTIKKKIKILLAKYNFDVNWQNCIKQHLQLLLKIQLLPEKKFCIGNICSKKCLPELEFSFDLNFKNKYTSVQKKTSSSFLERMQTLFWRGDTFLFAEQYLHGFIDLVFEHDGKFYIIDWKSNHLGSDFENYNHQNLKVNIEKSFYDLQYYIYTDALSRYLSWRVPNYDYEKHFGGVFYIYLRGIHLSKNTGIYFDRPSKTELTSFRTLYHKKENKTARLNFS